MHASAESPDEKVWKARNRFATFSSAQEASVTVEGVASPMKQEPGAGEAKDASSATQTAQRADSKQDAAFELVPLRRGEACRWFLCEQASDTACYQGMADVLAFSESAQRSVIYVRVSFIYLCLVAEAAIRPSRPLSGSPTSCGETPGACHCCTHQE